MSTAIAKNFQIGADSTPSNNFTLYQPASPDGTLRLGNGNTGITSSLLTLTSAGNLGVGTSSPSVRLHANVESASETDVARFQASNGGDVQFLDIGADATNNLVSFDVTGSSSGAYVFRSGGVERMRLTSAGDLGIGTSSPFAALAVNRAQGGASTIIGIQNDGTPGASTKAGFGFYDGGALRAALIRTRDGGASPISLETYDTVPLVFGTNSTERARFTSSGVFDIGTGAGAVGQIQFPATQVASSNPNTLDDYEEGTWTPAVRGSTTIGTYTLSTVYASYTKVGRQVTLSAFFNFSAASGGSGYLQITGAPFTKVSNTTFVGTARMQVVDMDANCKYLVSGFITSAETSTLYFDQIVDNGSTIDLPISAITTSSQIGLTITYFTA